MTADRIRRPEARVLAEEEFARFARLVASLADDDWTRPTDCTGWDVRAMALHILGSAEAQASPREFLHQMRRGLPLNKEVDSHHWVDGLNELQIRERSSLSNDELVARLAAVGPKAVAGRWKTPPPMRHLPLPFGPPIGWAPLRYLLDVGFTRDVWAHRIDISVALRRPMEATADHDGRLVADLVAEWADLHGEPFELVLEGPAGGKFSSGDGGERVEIDAFDFVRTLAGRLPGTGVLAHPLPLWARGVPPTPPAGDLAAQYRRDGVARLPGAFPSARPRPWRVPSGRSSNGSTGSDSTTAPPGRRARSGGSDASGASEPSVPSGPTWSRRPSPPSSPTGRRRRTTTGAARSSPSPPRAPGGCPPTAGTSTTPCAARPPPGWCSSGSPTSRPSPPAALGPWSSPGRTGSSPSGRRKPLTTTPGARPPCSAFRTGDVVQGVPVRVVELIGASGDVVFLHPHTLHAAAPNGADHPRLMVTGGLDVPL